VNEQKGLPLSLALPAAGLLEIDLIARSLNQRFPPPEDTPLQQQQQHINPVFWQVLDMNAH